MDKVLAVNTILGRSPLVVEICGPAGAGKTTLLRVLKQRHQVFVEGVHLRVRRIEHIPFFLSNAFLLLPAFFSRHRNSRWFTWDEIKKMVYLKGWSHVLRRQASNNGTVTVLDHGPVFQLSHLHAFGPQKINSQSFIEWWNRMLKQWAAIMYMLIWLDAPNVVLLERINKRNRWHIIKGKPREEAYECLKRYRTSYEQIITRLTASGGPTILRFDTHQKSVDQIVDEVLAAFSLESNGN